MVNVCAEFGQEQSPSGIAGIESFTSTSTTAMFLEYAYQ
jgi:hypothetical protein